MDLFSKPLIINQHSVQIIQLISNDFYIDLCILEFQIKHHKS